LELQDRIVGLAASVALTLLGLRLGHALDVSAEVLPPWPPSHTSSPPTSPKWSARTRTGCTSCRSTSSRKTAAYTSSRKDDAVTAFTEDGIENLKQIGSVQSFSHIRFGLSGIRH